jgi:voltage-gated potassium channel
MVQWGWLIILGGRVLIKRRHKLLLSAIAVLIALVFFGTAYFSYAEGWDTVDSFYFTAMTVTTIGYGDLVPSHEASKIVASLYAIICIPTAIFAFGIIAEEYIETRMRRIESKMSGFMHHEEEEKKPDQDSQPSSKKN